MRIILLLSLCLAGMPGTASALALGNLELKSTLNQPLEARIPLHRVEVEDVEEIKVLLGDKAAFTRAGIERPFVLTSLRFKVVRTAGGETYIEVSSREPIREPYLNFIVDVRSPSARMMREYSLLLNAAGS